MLLNTSTRSLFSSGTHTPQCMGCRREKPSWNTTFTGFCSLPLARNATESCRTATPMIQQLPFSACAPGKSSHYRGHFEALHGLPLVGKATESHQITPPVISVFSGSPPTTTHRFQDRGSITETTLTGNHSLPVLGKATKAHPTSTPSQKRS